MTSEDYAGALARALVLARQSLRGGNFPVGAVVIGPNGELLGSGSNRSQSTGSPMAHAETRALARATRALATAAPDSVLLASSAEPCLMCLGAVLHTPAIGTVAWAAGPASQAGSAINRVRASSYRHSRLTTIRAVAEPIPELRRQSRALLHRWCVEHDDPRAAMFDDGPPVPNPSRHEAALPSSRPARRADPRLREAAMTIQVDPTDTALLIIDMQNGFCHPDGTLGLGGVDVGPMQATIPEIRRLVELARDRGIPDIWSRQFHYPEDRTRDAHKIGSHVLKRPRPACMPGTWDAEIVDGLRDLLRPETEIIDKHKFSCFFDTRLHSLLRILGTRMLIVCGTATNTCVEATIRDAYMRDFDVLVAKDGVSGVNAAWHASALEVWDRYFGAVRSVAEIELALKQPTASASAGRG